MPCVPFEFFIRCSFSNYSVSPAVRVFPSLTSRPDAHHLLAVSPPPPSLLLFQWDEAGACGGRQQMLHPLQAATFQRALLHPLLRALHLPAQPQAPVPGLPLQRVQELLRLQQEGQSLALRCVPEGQVSVFHPARGGMEGRRCGGRHLDMTDQWTLEWGWILICLLHLEVMRDWCGLEERNERKGEWMSGEGGGSV